MFCFKPLHIITPGIWVNIIQECYVHLSDLFIHHSGHICIEKCNDVLSQKTYISLLPPSWILIAAIIIFAFLMLFLDSSYNFT